MPLVRPVPLESKQVQRRSGEAKDLFKIGADFDELPDVLMEHFC